MAGLLPLRLHTPDRDLDVAHLKSGRGPNVRAVECHEHRAAFGAADPVRAGTVEDLQTIRGPGKTTPDARVVGCLAYWQQHAHHPGGLAERQSRAEFGLDAHKLRCCSFPNQRRRPTLATGLVGLRLRLEAAASTRSPTRLPQDDPAKQRVNWRLR